MARYAADTNVPPERSLNEIRQTLKRYAQLHGNEQFVFGMIDKGSSVELGFQINHRRYRMVLPLPPEDSREFHVTPSGRQRTSASAAQEEWEQAVRQHWRALALWVKATLEAVEAGITTLEVAMQPHTILPSGQTVGEWMETQVEASYSTGRMPTLLLTDGD